MKTELIATIILAGLFLALFAMAEFLYYYIKLKAEITRKLVHLGTGLITLLFPVLLQSIWSVFALCFSFALLLTISLKYNFLKSINAIQRTSHGSISYPVSVFFCFYFYHWCRSHYPLLGTGYIVFYLPIVILAISDPLAALTGKRWPIGKYTVGNETKSFMGSTMFFLSAFLVSMLLLQFAVPENPRMFQLLISSAIIALTTAIAEGLSEKGFDNLLIPLTASISFLVVFTQFLTIS